MTRQRPDQVLETLLHVPRWRAIIRPTEFIPNRIETLAALWELLERCSVSFRGWSYPHISRWNEERGQNADYVECSSSMSHLEYSRFFQSGQFLHTFVFDAGQEKQERLRERVEQELLYTGDNFQPSAYMDFVGMVWTLTEITEFAARLTQTGALGPTIDISVGLRNVRDVVLASYDFRRSLDHLHLATSDALDHPLLSLSADQLAGRNRQQAVEMAHWFFERFGVRSIHPTVIKGMQDELFRS